MEHGGPPEKWAATQCLALSGVITDKIIVELVNHLHADNAVRTEKAGTLLAKLSQQSVSFQRNCNLTILFDRNYKLDTYCFVLQTTLEVNNM